jgi:outer membrane protein
MKTTKLAVALLAALGISAVATPAMAYEAGDWLIRGRIAHVNPNDDSGRLFVNEPAVFGNSDFNSVGKGVNVDSDTIPELDITYMITPNWGVELILGYSEHTVSVHNPAGATLRGVGLAGSNDVIDTKVLPPTLTLQYHFNPTGKIRPYVGAGVNYTYFFDEEVPSKSLVHSGNSDKIKLDSSWGLAAQLGVDVAVNEDWFVNFDVKYISMDTEAHFKNIATGSSRAKIKADIDPTVWSIGVGRRF